MSDFYNKYPYTDFHELNLDWVIERVKKLTEDWAATLEEWNSTEEQWQELYNYVHDYFNNLDVQVEINNKINAMILDGTFQQIATPIIETKVSIDLPGVVSQQIGNTVASQIDDVVASQIDGSVAGQIDSAIISPVDNWLADHITQPTTPVVDNTLTIAGAAADAKAVGDIILPDQLAKCTEFNGNDQYFHDGTSATIASSPRYKAIIGDNIGAGWTGTVYAFIRMKTAVPFPADNKYPYTAFIKLKNNTSTTVTIGFTSAPSFSSTYATFHVKSVTTDSDTYIVNENTFTVTAGTQFQFMTVYGSAADMQNIEHVYIMPSEYGNYISTISVAIDNTLTQTGEAADAKTVGDIILPEQLAKCVECVGNDRYFHDGQDTQISGSNRYKIDIGDNIGAGWTGTVYTFIRMKNSITFPADNKLPYTAFVKLKNNTETSVYIGLASGPSFNNTYATLFVKKIKTDHDAFITNTDEFIVTAGSAFTYIFIYGDVSDMANIDHIYMIPNEIGSYLNSVDTNQNDYGFISYGDSLTQGAGGNGTTYPAVLSSLFNNVSYLREGVGADAPIQIAYRANAGEIFIPANTNPTNYFTPQDNFGQKPFNIPPYDTSTTFTVFVKGVQYTATNGANGTMKIAGCPTANYPRRIRYQSKKTAGMYIIWAGTNSTRVFNDVRPYIDSIISELNNTNYIVCGLTVDEDGTKIADYNNAAKAYYREHFIDLKSEIVGFGLAIMNITPTSSDTARIAAGNVPSSLLSDSVHFNSDGYTLIAKLLQDKIYGLGYDRYLE